VEIIQQKWATNFCLAFLTFLAGFKKFLPVMKKLLKDKIIDLRLDLLIQGIDYGFDRLKIKKFL